MTGKKISDLPILPATQLDQAADSVVIVDASAQETKRMSIGDMVLGVTAPLVDSIEDIKLKVDATTPDLTPPPTPTGFIATGAISHVIVEHDAPSYQMGHGHLRSRLYGTPEIAGQNLPTFNESYELSRFSGTIYSQPSNPSTTWRLWLKWETRDGVVSVEPAPAGQPNGLQVKTGEDVAKLLEALNGELRESQLYSDLKSRIDLIDGPSTMIGSVAARLNSEATARATAILDEASARATGDSDLQSQINLIVAGTSGDLSELLAAIETEKTARTTADAAEATSRETLAAQLRGTYTGNDLTQVTTGLIHSERQARVSEDSALATSITTLASNIATDITDVRATIATEATTRATADSALTTSISTLSSTIDTNKSNIEAALLSEQTTRAQSDLAEASARQALAARVTTAEGNISTNASAISTEATVRSTADSTLATQITNLGSTVTNNYTTLDSAIKSEATTRANQDTAIASKIDTVQAQVLVGSEAIPLRFWGFDSDVQSWTSDAATSTVSGGIITFTPTANDPKISRAFSAYEQFIGSSATSVSARIRRISGTGTWEGNLYYSTATHSFLGSYRKQIAVPINPDVWNVVEWDMAQLTAGGNDWKDNTITAVRLDLVSDATSVWQIDWISVGVATTTRLSAALQQEATVRANQTGELFGKYTVKVDLNGYVSGFGLASTANNGTPTSEFIITADKFSIAPVQTDHTSNDGSPFFHRTTATTINGVSVPAGTYMKSAYIHDATITNAKIADLAVDSAKIANVSAAKITAGSIAVGQHIQSTNYVAGTTGWKINGDGNAELANAVVRGTVYASNGQFFGTLLGGASSAYNLGNGFYSGLDSSTYKWRVGNPSGARIQWSGSAVEVYDKNNKLTIASGDLSNTQINGVNVETITTAVTNFNASNDRNSAAITAPSIPTDGTAVDHVLQKNGSADISFEWTWSGTESSIDGFLVYVYQSSGSASYTFGTTQSAEAVYTLPANKRAFILYGVVADQYYTLGVRAYRRVDADIASSGIIQSNIIKPTLAAENPYRPSTSVAFSGDVVGTVNGISASNVNVWSAIGGAGKPENGATVGAEIGVNLSGVITPSNASTYIADAAITNDHIGSLNAEKLTAGTITAGRIDVTKLSGTSTEFTTLGTYTYTVPNGYTSIAITVDGAGGGGGSGASGDWYTEVSTDPHYPGATHTRTGGPGGVGGRGGRYIVTLTGVSSGSLINISIGANGTGGAAAYNSAGIAGTAGQSTSVTVFGSTFTALGGGGGGGGKMGVWDGPAGATGTTGTAGAGGGSGAAGAGSVGGAGGAGTKTSTSGAGLPGLPGRVLIECYNGDGVIARGEWSNLMTHLNQRLTSWTWP